MSEEQLRGLKTRRHWLLNSPGKKKWKKIAIGLMDRYEQTLEQLIACKNELKLRTGIVYGPALGGERVGE